MRCGEKCFYVKANLNGKVQVIPVNARTSPEARKIFRKTHGKQTAILSVLKKR